MLPMGACCNAVWRTCAGQAAVILGPCSGSHFREPPCKLFQTLPYILRQSFSSSNALSDSRSWDDLALVFALQARGRWFDPSCAHPERPGQGTDLGPAGRVSRSSDRHLTVVVNVDFRHSASWAVSGWHAGRV